MTLVPFCGRFLPCLRAVLRDPIRSLCVAGAIFFDASEHFLQEFLRQCCPCSFALPFGQHMQVAHGWTGVELAWPFTQELADVGLVGKLLERFPI